MKRIMGMVLALIMIIYGCTAFAESEAFTPITVSGDNYLSNLDLCIAAINGCTLDTEAVFSFNGIVGPRTEESGYLAAINGRGVSVIGGGVAQVATTIYLAVKNLEDIEVTEMRTYGSDFCADYVADAADAIVTDYNQPIDFKFINHGAPISIALWRVEDSVYCTVSSPEQGTAETAETEVSDELMLPDPEEFSEAGSDEEPPAEEASTEAAEPAFAQTAE